MKSKRLKIIDKCTAFVNSNRDKNAVICILKEGERQAVLINAYRENDLLNMFANVIVDHPEIGVMFMRAYNEVLSIILKKNNNNED